MKKWLSLLFVACFIAGIAIILTADTGIMGNYFSLKSETEFNKIDIPTHTHRALLMVGMISIKPPQSSFSTRIAPSE